jgi:hypothetical protein
MKRTDGVRVVGEVANLQFALFPNFVFDKPSRRQCERGSSQNSRLKDQDLEITTWISRSNEAAVQRAVVKRKGAPSM